MTYDLYETDKAKKSRRKLEKGGTHIKKSTRKAYEKLSQNPKLGTTFLEGTLRGKRKLKFMGDKLRLEFAICEECRSLNHTSLNNCKDCEQIPNNAVKIFDVFFRGRGY